MYKLLTSAVAAMLCASAANAATTIVNLSADSETPNAGTGSGGYAYNPVVVSLNAGSYSVGVIGVGGGGAYNAYSVYVPTDDNHAFSDGNWSFSGSGITTQSQPSSQRFDTASGALGYYGSLAPLMFTLASATSVSFALDDTAFPFFADDSGGVSLAISSASGAVPEPASWAMMLTGFAAIGGIIRSRRQVFATA